jgi:hypothetical protein
VGASLVSRGGEGQTDVGTVVHTQLWTTFSGGRAGASLLRALSSSTSSVRHRSRPCLRCSAPSTLAAQDGITSPPPLPPSMQPPSSNPSPKTPPPVRHRGRPRPSPLPLKQRKWSSERKEMEAERMCRRRGDEVVEVGVGRPYLRRGDGAADPPPSKLDRRRRRLAREPGRLDAGALDPVTSNRCAALDLAAFHCCTVGETILPGHVLHLQA